MRERTGESSITSPNVEEITEWWVRDATTDDLDDVIPLGELIGESMVGLASHESIATVVDVGIEAEAIGPFIEEPLAAGITPARSLSSNSWLRVKRKWVMSGHRPWFQVALPHLKHLTETCSSAP